MVVGFLTPQRNAMTLAAKDFVCLFFFLRDKRGLFWRGKQKIAWFKHDAF